LDNLPHQTGFGGLALGIAAFATFSAPLYGQGMGLNSYRQGIHDSEIKIFSDRPEYMGWAWGELYYGRTYESDLLVTNDCETARPMEAWVGSGISPYVSIAEVTSVPPKTTNFKIPITITTPPEPNIVVPPGGYSFDATPWVDVGARPLARIVLKHKADEHCRSKDKAYDVTGHIHVDPDPPGPDQDTDACTAIWNSGNPLPGYDLDQCTERFRELLGHYLDTVLQPYVDADPAAWDWFPSPEEIAGMSAESALEAKKQAAEKRATQAFSEEASE
jgi:hypothetical protein